MKKLITAVIGISLLSLFYLYSLGSMAKSVPLMENDILTQSDSEAGSMGYVVLQKDKSFDTQVKTPNTIYEICFDFDLNNKTVVIPVGSELKFNGGTLSNGTLVGQGTRISSSPVSIFNLRINMSGTWDVMEAYPEWYGAVGDGLVDDTKAIRSAIINFNQLLIPIIINRPFRITQSVIDNSVLANKKSIYLILHGRHSKTYRSIQNVGGLKLDKGVDLFDGTTSLDVGNNFGRSFLGELKNLVISTESITAENSPLSGSVFKNSEISGFHVDDCYIMSIGSFFKDTESASCSKIRNNTFLFIHCFAAFTDKTRHGHFVDSVIEGNYINGSGHNDLNTNDCMEFSTYNGSTIINNFIDHYRCIYNPKFKSGHGEVVSIANHYQVFKYLYNGNGFSWVFSSNSDVINWTANAVSLREMVQLRDKNNKIIPPCVVWFGDGSSNNVIVFSNLTFQCNIEKKFLYIQRDLFRNNDKLFVGPISIDNSLSNINDWDYANFGDNYAIVPGKENKSHPIVDVDIVSKVTTLPELNDIHTAKVFVGQKVELSGIKYIVKMDLFENETTSTQVLSKPKWSRLGEPDYEARPEVSSNIKIQHLQIGSPYYNTTYNTNGYWNGTRFLDSRGNSVARRTGRTYQRPSANMLNASYDLGYEYFDTDLGFCIYAINISHSEVTWVNGKGFTATAIKGSSSNRPVGIAGSGVLDATRDIGFEFFDTTLGKPIYVAAINKDTGAVTWVDSTGKIVY